MALAWYCEGISIHALREEGDGYLSCRLCGAETFLSTPSARRATRCRRLDGLYAEFLSTPSARRATRQPTSQPSRTRFLSTPSARRATSGPQGGSNDDLHFYPRPPRGGRPFAVALAWYCEGISIHALREEGDMVMLVRPAKSALFLSTPSARRATWLLGGDVFAAVISIHALLAEGVDRRCCRPPRGGRLGAMATVLCGRVTVLSPSSRRATVNGAGGRVDKGDGVVALLAEGDCKIAQKRAILNVQEG